MSRLSTAIASFVALQTIEGGPTVIRTGKEYRDSIRDGRTHETETTF